MRLPELETDRLLLRRQRAEDATIFHELWGERDPRVPEHRRLTAEGRPSIEDIAAHIRSDGEPLLFAVVRKETREVLGYCGLVFHGTGRADEPELAFELLSRVHGRGYATEAAQAVIAWAGSAGHRRLWASVWEWNVASRRVLEKLGFRDSGQLGALGEHGRSLVTVRGDRPAASPEPRS